MRLTGKLLAALAVLGLSATAAMAETTGWISGSDAIWSVGKLDRDHQIVTGIECKDSGRASLGLDSALVRLTYGPNSGNRAWMLQGWSNLTEANKKWQRLGYSLFKYDAFVREDTGLRLYCIIYYK